jgi:TnpA family transposase
VKRYWTEEELAECWSLTTAELEILPDRGDHNRLSFAVLLKFVEIEGRFPGSPREVPAAALSYLASQLHIPPTAFARYDWTGRTCKRHRASIRALLGFRPFSLRDAKPLRDWLCSDVVPSEHNPQHLHEMALTWCRERRIEPPSNPRIERIVRSALRTHESQFFEATYRQLPPETRARLDALLLPAGLEDSASAHEIVQDPQDTEGFIPMLTPFGEIKTDPGAVGLASVLKELDKLKRLSALALPADLFAGVPPKVLLTYRARAAAEPPREMRMHPEPVRYTLLGAFCWQRRQEIIDGLVDLLIQVIHRLSVRAEKRVVKELLHDLSRVHGKTALLYKLAEAALAAPDATVREVVYPIIGEQTLAALVKESQSEGPAYRQHVHALLRSSYSHHYRRMLPPILEALTFRSNNAAHRPVTDALAWLKARRDSRRQWVTCDEVPIDGVVRPSLQDLLIETSSEGEERIHRINYEICVLQALRERLRCKEIWVEGADRYHNPDDDLPADFEHQRAAYYQALQLPQDADTFIAQVQQVMQEALAELDQGLPRNAYVKLRAYGNHRIVLSPLEAQPEPCQLGQIKAEVLRRWPMTGLLDMLKETDLRAGLTSAFHSVASREVLDRNTLQPRLLRCLYGLGTNAGLKRMAASAEDIGYKDLLYVRRRYIQKDALREAISRVVNATFAARLPEIWGEATTACASDSRKFGAWDQNLLTEWHIRYGGRGVMIYWHVEKRAVCIHSQLKRCSSSEVASMIEGVLHHCTEMAVEKQYVDSHGQSEVAFGLCQLLGFDLLPRLKDIASQKLYRPSAGAADDYPNLQPILIRPIDWALIRQQYDEMVKYATALRLGTADSEAILKRFSRGNLKHPTYQALAELGKAIKTRFLCRYLHSEGLRREVHEGLNVVENWNSANDFIFYGKSGEIATNRLEDQELAVLSLHLLQASLVYINTLMVQQVLTEPAWSARMTSEDYRALTPLIYHHVNPYGLFELDMAKRLPLEQTSGSLAA